MIPNLYIENGCFTKHPLKHGCLGFQVYILCHGRYEIVPGTLAVRPSREGQECHSEFYLPAEGYSSGMYTGNTMPCRFAKYHARDRLINAPKHLMVRFDRFDFWPGESGDAGDGEGATSVHVCRDVDRVGHLLQLRDLLKLELSQSQVDRFRGSLYRKVRSLLKTTLRSCVFWKSVNS